MTTDVHAGTEGEASEAVDQGLIEGLVARAQASGMKMTGEGGLLTELTRRTLEATLEGELTDHLGHEPGDRAEESRRDNYRNGHRTKTVTTEVGPVGITVPRDRAGRQPADPPGPGRVKTRG